MLRALIVSDNEKGTDYYKSFLKENGCDVVQGYYLSKPLPLEDFEALIKKELI